MDSYIGLLVGSCCSVVRLVAENWALLKGRKFVQLVAKTVVLSAFNMLLQQIIAVVDGPLECFVTAHPAAVESIRTSNIAKHTYMFNTPYSPAENDAATQSLGLYCTHEAVTDRFLPLNDAAACFQSSFEILVYAIHGHMRTMLLKWSVRWSPVRECVCLNETQAY